MRVAYAPTNPTATRARYVEVRQRVLDAVAKGEDGAPAFDPSPRNLREFLRDRLHDEYELRYFVLDPARFDAKMVAEAGYDPAPLTGRDRSGREILNGLLHIDFLNAQRHLSDGPGGSRAEDLSRVLSRFYGRNLEQKGEDIEALRALAASEVSLNEHLERVFEPTLKSLSKLGYPGLSNPRMMIRSALDPAQIMSGRDGAVVHYALGGADEGNPDPPTLPDRYNGLGFKNLIFMVVELLDLHAQWLAIEENRPPVHLIFIEEPEAHLHAQLQQAFIRKVMDILTLKGEDRTHYTSQVVVTTHSTHILYERGFRPVRYFRRSRARNGSTSDVLNLSVFYDNTDSDIRSFLERYLKLAHCDLFFADGAVLVEGNVERLLLPQMIANAAPRLQSTYLTVLEIGGAFGYQSSEAPCIGRYAAGVAGLPDEVPGYTVDRRCGSGLQAVIDASMQVQTGNADAILVTGVESMSNIEYYSTQMRWGARLGDVKFYDRLDRGRANSQPQSRYGESLGAAESTELIVREYGITREESDRFAVRSHQRAARAWEEGRFKDEVVAVQVPQRKGASKLFAIDEGIRNDADFEAMSQLRPLLKNGTVTAGNASQQNDAAAGCLVVSERYLKEFSLDPMARLAGWAAAAVHPMRFGLGPVPAVAKLMHRMGLTLSDMDLIEVNEAFAGQVLCVLRDWDLADDERVNVNGSGISLGHPIGATGIRILTSMLYEMKRRNARYGLETMCIGGGQGLAAVFERC